MEITSVNNELVKETAKLQQKKYRNQTGKFLLEGYKSIKEASDCGIEIEHVFVDKKHLGEYDFTRSIIETNEIVLKKISTTESAPEAVAVGIQKKYDNNVIKNMKKLILLEGIKDAGNLGTILRSAAAFGVDGVVLFGDCVDIYNPKTVRSSVGNLWKIPVIHIENFVELKEIFKNFSKIATLPKTDNYLKKFKPKYPCVIMFGSEADGLSDELIKLSDESLKIEMKENVESLNLASSVSIIMYQLFV